MSSKPNNKKSQKGNKTTNVCIGRYFPGISSTQPDPKFFNDVINIPPKGLNELLYRRPENTLIKLVEDAVCYTNSKI